MTKPTLPAWPRRMQAPLAAAYCGISRSKFLREVAAGRLPRPVADGGNRLWYREDLDAALDAAKGAGAGSDPRGGPEDPYLAAVDDALDSGALH